jgi:predicted RNA polymerase sigma factor
MFICCHPVLSAEARVALTLRLLGGLTTEEIARAFLVPEKTIAQRIVRAKRNLAEARVPFELPRSAERASRLASVLEVIYLVFNEGYAATAGDDWIRPTLCEEALRIGRILAGLAAQESGAWPRCADGNSSVAVRRAGRGVGEPVLLLDQNRARWDQRLLIRRGLAARSRAEAIDGARGQCGLQAAIAACHAGRAPPRRLTGCASRHFTPRSHRSRPHLWSNSIGRSRWRLHSVPQRAWRWSIR